VACASDTAAYAIAVGAELAVRGPAWAKGRDTVIAPTHTVPRHQAGVRRGVVESLVREPAWVMCDSRASDWTADEHEVIDAIHRLHERVLLVMVASMYESWAHLAAIVDAASMYDIPVLHDGAHCGGGRYTGTRLPCLDVECLNWGKWHGAYAGDGGVIYTSDELVAVAARAITDEGAEPAGPLNPSGRSLSDIELPFVSADRMQAIVGAAALGTLHDIDDHIPTMRRVRREIGTEIQKDGMTVFRTAPIGPDWGHGPTFGLALELTAEAHEEYGLGADQWHDILAAEGFATGQYPFGVRRCFRPAHPPR
jgi:dTDP-4-amino-4,6-dideoxygalactose transaminase